MVQKNFILTDIMKTGNHNELEQFIKFSNLDGQHFDMTGEWYRLHDFEFNKYDRLIALVDIREGMSVLFENHQFVEDMKNRCRWLIDKGFKIIITNPWECKKYALYERHLPFDKGLVWSGDCSWFWFKMYHRYKNHKFNFYHHEKKYDFLYLNKVNRPHREMLFKKLMKNDLLTDSLFSFLDKGYKLKREYELPWLKIENYPKYGYDRDIFEPQFNDSKFNLVSETIVHEEKFMTEKIWKPIIAGQIFIVHGKHQYLHDLKKLGYMTYNNYFDESYDSLKELDQRTNAIVKLCSQLKDISYKELYDKTKHIRIHNQKIFFSEKHLKNACCDTITRLLELVDSGQVSSRET